MNRRARSRLRTALLLVNVALWVVFLLINAASLSLSQERRGLAYRAMCLNYVQVARREARAVAGQGLHP